MNESEKSIDARKRNADVARNKIISAIRRYGHPVTSYGIAEESGYPPGLVGMVLPKLLSEGVVRIVPDEDMKLYEVVE